jgi:CspA family cold shock protein
MKQGKVKFFNKSKGFGFIIEDFNNNEIFFHFTSVKKGELKENDKVQFEIEQTQKGVRAINVSLV